MANRVLIHLEKPIKDTMTIHGQDGAVDLKVDTDFYPWLHVITQGVVVATPNRLIYSEKGDPGAMTWKTELDIAIGDTVIFDYFASLQCFGSVVNPNHTGEADAYLKSDEGNWYIFLTYDNLHYNLTRGIALNGYIPIKLDMDDYIGEGLKALGLENPGVAAKQKNTGLVMSEYSPCFAYDQIPNYQADPVRLGDRIIFTLRRTRPWRPPAHLEGTILIQDRYVGGRIVGHEGS